MEIAFYIKAQDGSGENYLIGMHPSWNEIDHRINNVFQYGGAITLFSGELNEVGTIGLGHFVAMHGPKRNFRLIYEKLVPIGTKPDSYHWSEPEGTPFRGVTMLYDFGFDSRTFCTDVEVPKAVFRDFFDHGTLTDTGMSYLRSDWDPLPRD